MGRNNLKTSEKAKKMVMEGKIGKRVKKNRFLFKKGKKSGNQQALVIYRRKNTLVKQLVAEAKKESNQKWCQDLSKTRTRHRVFRLAVQLNNNQNDEVGVKLIKNVMESSLLVTKMFSRSGKATSRIF